MGMKLTEIEFEPKAGIVFGEGDIPLLMEWSKHHYDFKCRAAGAVGGFLYGLSNREDLNPQGMIHTLTFREVDTLAKIAEGNFGLDPDGRGPEIRDALADTMHALNKAKPENVKIDDPNDEAVEPPENPIDEDWTTTGAW